MTHQTIGQNIRTSRLLRIFIIVLAGSFIAVIAFFGKSNGIYFWVFQNNLVSYDRMFNPTSRQTVWTNRSDLNQTKNSNVNNITVKLVLTSKIRFMTNLDSRTSQTTSQVNAKAASSIKNTKSLPITTIQAVPKKAAPPKTSNSFGFDIDYYNGYYIPDIPEHSDDLALYPNKSDSFNSRVFAQLSYVPKIPPTTTKLILLPHSYEVMEPGHLTLDKLKCKVNACTVTTKMADLLTADIIILSQDTASTNQFENALDSPHYIRPPGQLWGLYNEESPNFVRSIFRNKKFNWTLTYTPSSTIPITYGNMYPINANVTTLPQTKNYAENKSGKVVWFVSNCHTPNDRRGYVRQLERYISVTIYGHCGKVIPNCNGAQRQTLCMHKHIVQYKFYLSFENSNCQTYVTEKFYLTGLGYQLLPIVMGASRDYIKQIAPPHSYIHVDDFSSAKDLANYLNYLDKNDTAYNEYFQWKGAWSFLPKRNWLCRVCALLHAPRHKTDIHSIAQWKQSDPCRGPIHF